MRQTFIFIFTILAWFQLAHAQVQNSDTFQIGQKGSTATKALKIRRSNNTTIDLSVNDTTGKATINATELGLGTGNNSLRVNAGNLEFTNDGSLYKKVGSGSGSGDGGTSVLENASFEDGLTPGWTNSGGTWSQQTYSNGVEGDTKFARLVASASGQYFESTAKAVPDNLGFGCLAYLKYSTTDNNAWKVDFYSGVSVIGSQTLPTTEGNWLNSPPVSVPCPTPGTLIKIRVESLAAATINGDRVYLGNENRTVALPCQGTVACENVFTAKFTSAGTTSDESLDWVNGNAPFTSSYTLTPVAGTFTVTPNCVANATSLNRATIFRQDLSSASALIFSSYNTSTGATVSDTAFTVACAKQGVDFVKSKPVTAVTSEQSGWFIDANIGGADPNLTLGTFSSYTGITDAGLDMILRPGSASAQIGCSTTVSPSGLVCSSGSESVSVAWTPPFAGWFDVCFNFSHRSAGDSSGDAMNTTFQVVETPTNAQTILAEGGSRIFSRAGGGIVGSVSHPFNLCGSFYASSTAQKMHRLMYEQSTAGTPTESFIPASRDPSLGQFDIRVQVRPSTMNQNRPVLTGDQVTTQGATGVQLFSWRMGTGATVLNPLGSLAPSACSAISSSYRTCPLPVTLSAAPNCVCVVTGDGECSIDNASTTASQVRVGTENSAGSQFDIAATVLCQGVK